MAVDVREVLTTPSVRESITTDLLNKFGTYLTAEMVRMIDGAVSAMRDTFEGNIRELRENLAICVYKIKTLNRFTLQTELVHSYKQKIQFPFKM